MQGLWKHAGILYRDRSKVIVVDVPDSAESRVWMKAFKKRWKEKLQQLELWMVSYRVEVE